jgi:hypothetical protein
MTITVQDKKNHTIAGNYYSKYMQYLELKVRRCNGKTLSGGACANKTVIDRFFSQSEFSFAFINNFFDFNNYTDSI